MRVLSILVLLPLLLASGGSGAKLTAAEAAEDVALLELALKELHGGLYRYATPEEVDAAFAGIRQRVRSPLTATQMYRLLSGLAPVVRDGHTDVLPAEEPARVLPLRVRVMGEKLFDLESQREITAINGMASSGLIREAEAMQWRDGNSRTRAVWLLNHGGGFNRALALLQDVPAAYDVTFAGGRKKHVQAGPRPGRMAPAAEATLRFLDGGRIAVLTVPSFGPDLGARFQESFQAIRDRGSPVLIIDIRDNGGGLDRNGALLFSYLARSPFRYYNGIFVNTLSPSARVAKLAEPLRGWRIEGDDSGRLRFTGHSVLGVNQPSPPRFDGEVVVLINGGTFSAAAEFAAMVRHHRRGTFVGEETGGAFCGNTAGATSTLTLPHSGLRVEIPMMRYEMAVSGFPMDRGVIPETGVSPTLDDLGRGRDPVLARALAMARTAMPTGASRRKL